MGWTTKTIVMSWSFFSPWRRPIGGPFFSPDYLWVFISTVLSPVVSGPWRAPWCGYREVAWRSLITPARHKSRRWLSFQGPLQHSPSRLAHCWSSTKHQRYGHWVWVGGLGGMKVFLLGEIVWLLKRNRNWVACFPKGKIPTTGSSWCGGCDILAVKLGKGSSRQVLTSPARAEHSSFWKYGCPNSLKGVKARYPQIIKPELFILYSS